jgi:hypothetical protein
MARSRGLGDVYKRQVVDGDFGGPIDAGSLQSKLKQ